MKLYLYDHCPFCVRVEMVAHYKNVSCEQIYLLNDDEDTCYRLINAKQLPILEFDDGHCMAESLDIVRKLDDIGDTNRMLRPQTHAETITRFFDSAHLHISCLLYPRIVLMSGLPEFATQSAKDYFQRKKEQNIGRTFAQAMAETTEHKTNVETMLAQLPPLPLLTDETIGWDDVLIYPTLRNLTMVRGLQFPQPVRTYINTISRITRTYTYDERAIS